MAHTAHSDPEMVRERYDSQEELERKVDELVRYIQDSRHFVVFTGAGISTSAGIPDFRGPDGKWTREAQGKRPLAAKVPTVSAIPTPTHMALVDLLETGRLKYVISQNCDGLHRRSGVPAERISELHGNSNVEVCEECGQSYLRDLACHRYASSRDHATGRVCGRAGCGGSLLEYTIDFSQHLPQEPLRLAEAHSRQADLHVVFGSSLTVSPACEMPRITARRRGGRLVIVNLQPTPLDAEAALTIHARTDTVSAMIMERLGRPVPPFRLQRRLIAERRPAGPATTVALKTVDVHDPSLELSQLREVGWPAAPLESLARVPVTLGFVGHYSEPDLPLVLDLATTAYQDVRLAYDPHQRTWAIAAQQSIERDYEPSAKVLAQREHGLAYAQSHGEYVVAGIAKANPRASRSECEDGARRLRDEILKAARAGRGRSVTYQPASVLTRDLDVCAPRHGAEDIPMADAGSAVVGSGAGSVNNAEADDPPLDTKVPVPGRPGEFRKVATPAQLRVMDHHVKSCAHPTCHGVWQGPWGPFIGGQQGREYFDLTRCPDGANLNHQIGWIEVNPRA